MNPETTNNSVGMAATEKDGEWIGEAMEGVLPSEMDSRVWLQEEATEVSPGRLANKFRELGHNLVVLASVAPIHVHGSEEKKVSYHVIAYRAEGDKVKKPNEADISRVRKTFFCRDLTSEERVYEGSVGESKAYHFMTVFKQPSIILED